MRALVLASGLGLLAGCLAQDGNFELDLCGVVSGDCVSAKQPFLFRDETPTEVALGGEANVAYLAHDTLTSFEIASDDPAVLTVERRDGRVFVIHAVGEGSTAITARASDGSALGQLAIRVAKIASVGFAFTPAGDRPLPELAALPGAREQIRVLPFAKDGSILSGANHVLDISFMGDLERIDPATAQARPGEFRLFYADQEPGFDIGVRFGALGAGSITASFQGAPLGTIAIEVIAAASEVALRLSQPAAPAVVETDSLLVLGLVGSDANGVPVAGLLGEFTATPPDLVTITSFANPGSPTGEVLVSTHATPGSATVTAKLPDRTVSTTIAIQPRAR